VTRVLAAMLLLAAAAVADRAVTMDGVVLEGDVSLAGDTVTVVRGRRTTTYDRDEFHLVERDDGVHVWSPDFVGRMRGYEYLARARRRDELEALLETAIKAKNAELARRILELAEADGWTGSKAEKAREKVFGLEHGGKGSPTAARARAQEEIEARLPVVMAGHVQLLVARARLELAEDPRREVGLRILRRALELQPDDEKAKALLARAKPEQVHFDARWWLDWYLDLELTGASLAAQEGVELRRARQLWRKDLYEIRAGPIRLITPVLDTRVAGRCLAHARLACSVLADLLAAGKEERPESDALTVFLYASRDEYLTVSGTGRDMRGVGGFLEHTSGHYASDEGISRFYWSDRPEEERRLASVAVHELTHHWIDRLCPGIGEIGANRGPLTPGFWIVEGIATFMEEGLYDVERRRWEPFHPRLRSLDVVRALAEKNALLPWSRVYTMSQAMFGLLTAEDGPTLVRDWAMGEQKISVRRVFYEQAAATCHYLYHAEKGKYRRALLDCLRGHYTVDTKKFDIAALVGMTTNELGARVVAFARAPTRE